jgi:hypothetical protein
MGYASKKSFKGSSLLLIICRFLLNASVKAGCKRIKGFEEGLSYSMLISIPGFPEAKRLRSKRV